MKNTLIVTGSIVLFISASAFGGTAEKKSETKSTEPKAEPITFADGLFTIDLEGRVRFEARSNNRDFDDSINDDNDDSWAVTRLRLGLAIKPAPWVKLYAQLQDTREFDSDRVNTPGLRGNEGDDNFDLRQAYIELADYSHFPLGLTVGRQRLSYGEQRLIADSRWGNLGRTFDAIKIRWQPNKTQWLDLFASRPVQFKEEVFDDNDSEDNFFGAYYSNDALLRWQTTDLYLLYRDKKDDQPDLDPTNKIDPRGTWNGPAQRIATLGTRWKSKPGALNGWDYTLEAAYQWGDVWVADRNAPALDHRAFAAHLDGGYTWEDAAWKPRIGLGYSYASGDSDPTDGDSGGFQNLFPSNHAKFGDSDPFGWRNIHNIEVRLGAKPAKNVELELSYHATWLADTSDYWYRSNGNSTLRTRTPDGRDVRAIGAGNFAGHEVDLIAKWTINSHLNLEAGYSHFFAGEYLTDTGPSDDADFAYVLANFAF